MSRFFRRRKYCRFTAELGLSVVTALEIVQPMPPAGPAPLEKSVQMIHSAKVANEEQGIERTISIQSASDVIPGKSPAKT